MFICHRWIVVLVTTRNTFHNGLKQSLWKRSFWFAINNPPWGAYVHIAPEINSPSLFTGEYRQRKTNGKQTCRQLSVDVFVFRQAASVLQLVSFCWLLSLNVSRKSSVPCLILSVLMLILLSELQLHKHMFYLSVDHSFGNVIVSDGVTLSHIPVVVYGGFTRWISSCCHMFL